MDPLLSIIQYEDHLSSYAQKSSGSKGRKYKEMPHPFRNPYQRDRDRVVHSRAFRRLEYKTQVLTFNLGDHYRTRMTHSLEVSLLSRSVARALNVHEDLTEAIALAHDLGHPPFGHAGEKVLDELMREEGGFEHNLQSLRIVDALENKYPQFPGLNLTYEVRRGLVKHADFSGVHFLKKEKFNLEETLFLEAQIVDIADAIAYSSHDFEDGLSYGYLRLEDVKKLGIWNHTDAASVSYSKEGLSEEILIYHLTRSLIDFLVRSLVQETKHRIDFHHIKTVQDICSLKHPLAVLSPDTDKEFKQLKAFLMQNYYKNTEILNMTRASEKIIRRLFAYYLKNPGELPNTTYKKTRFRSLKRVICDYIAGMTDRFAIEDYKKRGFKMEDRPCLFQ